MGTGPAPGDLTAQGVADNENGLMGLLTRIRRQAAGPRARVLADLTSSYHAERRLADQLGTHAGAVPYPSLANNLRDLAETSEQSSHLLQAAVDELGATIRPSEPAPPRSGRNHWERLTFDLDDLRTMSRQYVEFAQHWDVEYPEVAALFSKLARATGASGRTVRDMIARSDSHAVD